MDIGEFRSRIANRDMTRRGFKQALARLGLAVVAQPMLMRGARAHNDPARLVSLTWAGYDIPDLIAEYTAKHGAMPEYSLFASVPEAAEKLAAGFHADVAHPCAHNVRQWHDRGLIGPVDVSRLRHWQDVWSELRDIEGVRLPEQDNQVFMVPFEWGNTSICYRTDLLPPDVEESWGMILDPAYKGHISAVSDTGTIVGVALALGIEPYTMNDGDLDRVREAMVRQRELVKFYWDSGSDLTQALAAGEVHVALCYNEHAAALKKDGVPVKFAHPKEGVITWLCGMVKCQGAEADDGLIYDFVDAMLAPETGAFLISEYGYGHSNAKAFDLVAPDRLAALGIAGAGDMLKDAIFAVEGTQGMRGKWETLVEEVTLGM